MVGRSCAGVVILLALVMQIARADEAPPTDKPWTLDSNNWQLAQGLLPAPVLERVKNGEYHYQVLPVDPDRFRQNYSAAFWQASEANQDKFDIDSATCGLKDKASGKVPEFWFGYPFPKIDPNDPQAACKMAWNFDAAGAMGGGGGATFTLNGADATGEFKRVKAG